MAYNPYSDVTLANPPAILSARSIGGKWRGEMEIKPIHEQASQPNDIQDQGATCKDLLERMDAAERKRHPIASGVINYFPDALVAIAGVSFIGNEQHNPGTPLHWDRSKSTDESDALMRHFIHRGKLDSDGVRHSAKLAWRALALLQKEIEHELEGK